MVGQMILLITCKTCKREFDLVVDKERFMRWKSGEGLIQRMLPNLTADERELLMNQMCGKCYDDMFPDDER